MFMFIYYTYQDSNFYIRKLTIVSIFMIKRWGWKPTNFGTLPLLEIPGVFFKLAGKIFTHNFDIPNMHVPTFCYDLEPFLAIKYSNK